MSLRHRILRRGKPYGPPLFDPAVLTKLEQPEALQAIVDLVDDGQPRGVHFLCANANIKSQFEFIQQVWVNNPAFGGLLNNRDPLVGDNDAAASVMVIPGQCYLAHVTTSALYSRMWRRLLLHAEPDCPALFG